MPHISSKSNLVFDVSSKRINYQELRIILIECLNPTHFRSEVVEGSEQKKKKFRTRVYITNEKYETNIRNNNFSHEPGSQLKDTGKGFEQYSQSDPVICKSKFSLNKENINCGGKTTPIYENLPRNYSRSNSGSSRDSLSSGGGQAKPLVGILKVPGRRKRYFSKHVEFLEDQEFSVRQF